MRERITAVCALCLVLAACTAGDMANSAADPPTLLVTNSSCSQGGCRTLEVRAFVWMFTIPQLPTGSMHVGYVRPGQTCLVFPPSITATVRGVDSLGRTTDSTSYTWTPGEPRGIYLITVDSALFHAKQFNQAQIDSLTQAIFPFDGYGNASVGSSVTFVPGQHAGWAISFPSSPIRSASVIPGAMCSP
jgi:hypothetical protein